MFPNWANVPCFQIAWNAIGAYFSNCQQWKWSIRRATRAVSSRVVGAFIFILLELTICSAEILCGMRYHGVGFCFHGNLVILPSSCSNLATLSILEHVFCIAKIALKKTAAWCHFVNDINKFWFFLLMSFWAALCNSILVTNEIIGRVEKVVGVEMFGRVVQVEKLK